MFEYLAIWALISAVGAEELGLPEGSPCMAEGQPGICVDIDKCLSDTIFLNRLNTEPVVCSKIGKDPVVCCRDCSFVYDARKAVVHPRGGILWKTGERAHDACLEFLDALPYKCKELRAVFFRNFVDAFNCSELYFTDPVAGGNDALRGEYPHMALLGYGPNEDSVDWLCGGSIISENFILTAAHCISSATKGRVKYVALGILKRTDPPELWQKLKVKTIVPHPKYKSPSKYHDIALLETEKKISFDQNTLPACLATLEWETPRTAEVTGWGALGYRKELADTLQTVQLERFTDEECSKHYPKHRHLRNGYDNETQICYGDRRATNETRDTCEGDSGGPMQALKNPATCQYYLLGVTSYGRTCGSAGGSGMYTRLLPYLDWIQDVVWPLV